ncbi:N-acetylmuramoyl-L-alanine amidase, partial [Clostridium sp.]|uniref:N-acetylmuramoyl-L-alanine amidase n=1 Tax=Clostridium sp. TaxID=1506 RepID=UPI0034649ED2
MNRKQSIYIMVVALIVIVLSTTLNNVKAYAIENNAKVILIDPGHGGFDGGAKTKNGTIEKGINLEISKKLKAELEKEGYKVYMTREEDKSLDHSTDAKIKKRKVEDLSKRCEMKKETKCDMFISIHLNMFTSSKSRGAQIWYSDFPESKVLADTIQGNFKENLDSSNNRLAKAALDQYRVLRDKYEAPCII